MPVTHASGAGGAVPGRGGCAGWASWCPDRGGCAGCASRCRGRGGQGAVGVRCGGCASRWCCVVVVGVHRVCYGARPPPRCARGPLAPRRHRRCRWARSGTSHRPSAASGAGGASRRWPGSVVRRRTGRVVGPPGRLRRHGTARGGAVAGVAGTGMGRAGPGARVRPVPLFRCSGVCLCGLGVGPVRACPAGPVPPVPAGPVRRGPVSAGARCGRGPSRHGNAIRRPPPGPPPGGGTGPSGGSRVPDAPGSWDDPRRRVHGR